LISVSIEAFDLGGIEAFSLDLTWVHFDALSLLVFGLCFVLFGFELDFCLDLI
jgi:hypothetical protein